MLIVEVDGDFREFVPTLDPVKTGLSGVMIQTLETTCPMVMDRGRMS